MIEIFNNQLEKLTSRQENKFGHIIRLKTANVDFLTVEDLIPTFLPFNSLFIDVNFSKFEMEFVYPKIKVLKNLLDDFKLIGISRQAQMFRPRVRIMNGQDYKMLNSMQRFSHQSLYSNYLDTA